MPRSRPLLACALSASVASWTCVGAAQADGAPLPAPTEPPAAPTPGEPAPPTEVPAAPPAPAEPAPAPAVPPPEPPATPPPAPPTAPPSGAFPLPPDTPASAKKPPRRAEPPPSATSAPEPAAPTAQPPSEPARAQKPSDGLFQAKPSADSALPADKDDGVDQFKIGPVAGVGIPSIISFGGTLKLTRFLGGGVNVGLIPKVQLSYYGDATLSYQHYDIYGRIYPFGGGFFLSGGAGYATVDGTLSSKKTVATGGFSGTVDYNSKGSVRTLMLTALIGYFYTTKIGFSFGVDAGAQIPIAPSRVSYSSTYDVSSNVPPVAQAEFEKQALPIKQQTDKSVQDTLESIGRTTLPTLNLRIGWIL